MLANEEEKLDVTQEELDAQVGFDSSDNAQTWRTYEVDAETAQEAVDFLMEDESYVESNDTIDRVFDITDNENHILIDLA